MGVPLSILDLTAIRPGETAKETLRATVTFAQRAEALGYKRIWYAEHHNNAVVASSTPSVIIAHVGAHTNTIRLGAGGIMLPNHSPLVVAEQFGLLENLYPGRIDLGLGRAPGTDPKTTVALRRTPNSADRFPEDVLELQGYLTGASKIEGVEATPEKGSNVPLYILGSSMFGATLAAKLGLPYAFASQFAPDALQSAVAAYRRNFRPSAALQAPYVIAGINVIAADTKKDAEDQFLATKRLLVGILLAGGRHIPSEQADAILASPAGHHVLQILTYTALGTGPEVRDHLEKFTAHADADELMLVFQSPTTALRMRSLELVAEGMSSMA